MDINERIERLFDRLADSQIGGFCSELRFAIIEGTADDVRAVVGKWEAVVNA